MTTDVSRPGLRHHATATVATLGLLGHTHWLELPPSLSLLTDWWLIGASAALFCVEFFADKVPAFDLVWNALHTFVRIPLAALLAYRATLQLSPEMQLLATIGGALIAAAAHSSKTAARTLVTPSPEPISNIALSTGEDAAAIRPHDGLEPPAAGGQEPPGPRVRADRPE